MTTSKLSLQPAFTDTRKQGPPEADSPQPFLMGCCSSRPRDEGQSSPYAASDAHGDSSSRAITSAATPVPEAPTPRADSIRPTTEQSHRQRIGLTEQFNQPIRPHVWTSKRNWTRHDLDREREAFFDTRVTGRQEIWGALKLVVGLLGEHDIQTAQGILDASVITVPTGDLVNGAYDEVGNYYQMPEHMISDPENLVPEEKIAAAEPVNHDGEDNDDDTDEEEAERRREEKGKAVLKSGESFKVKARLSDRGGPDMVITLAKDQNVRVLARRIQDEAGIVGKGKIRIAYLGKILKEGETLQRQGWREGHVVNALVFQ